MKRLSFARHRRKEHFTHYLFRFPAKFHPPAIRSLIERYTRPGDTILDPFCGSGTLLVESLLAGRNAIGIDIDPVATFVSRVKSKPLNPELLDLAYDRLVKKFKHLRRTKSEYERLMFKDLSFATLRRRQAHLQIPAIPSINHWFRSYVAIDLARIRNTILRQRMSPAICGFFLGIFASIIRNSSNADPVPVSGLEVTAHMRRLEKEGRYIDPFELFERRAKREIRGMSNLWANTQESKVRVIRGDATAIQNHLRGRKVDVVITSPPYNTSVDYYRRHMLEIFWLGIVACQEERQRIAASYIGRVSVPKRLTRLATEFDSPYVNRLISEARGISALRKRAIVHYCASMRRTLGQCAVALRPGGKALFVVGNAKWNGKKVRATKLLTELAKPHFTLVEQFSYPSRNRYMSYSRHNGADVNYEYVVVLKKGRGRRKPSA